MTEDSVNDEVNIVTVTCCDRLRVPRDSESVSVAVSVISDVSPDLLSDSVNVFVMVCCRDMVMADSV